MGGANPVVTREAFLTRTQLKARGWTDRLIAALLGVPDQQGANPHYKSGPPMRLYRQRRVEAAEATPQFREATAARAGRREGARRAVATKRARVAGYVAGVTVAVPRLDDNELVRAACRHWNDRRPERGGSDEPASPTSDPAFVARLAVNYLRHVMTPYDEHLTQVAGRVGASDAYLGIKEKVLDAIGEAYPWLADECDRQLARSWREAGDR